MTDNALRIDFGPRISLFTFDAIQCLEDLQREQGPLVGRLSSTEPLLSRSPTVTTLRASRCPSDPTKVKMTPELRQDLAFARIVREEQLRGGLTHPYLRDQVRSEFPASPSEDSFGARSPGTIFDIDIDDVIRHWQQDTSPKADLKTLGSQSSDTTQDLRREYSLSILCRPRSIAFRHPKHDFDRHAKKLMCRNIHNPMEILPPLPVLNLSKQTHLLSLDTRFLKDSNTAEFHPPRKCANSLCDEYCCHYAKLFAKAITKDKDIMSVSRAVKSLEEMNILRQRKPNGVDEWETFLQCTLCTKQFCPACIQTCCYDMCQLPYCLECGNSRAYCEIHDE